jgi:hypothetical protein
MEGVLLMSEFIAKKALVQPEPHYIVTKHPYRSALPTIVETKNECTACGGRGFFLVAGGATLRCRFCDSAPEAVPLCGIEFEPGIVEQAHGPIIVTDEEFHHGTPREDD